MFHSRYKTAVAILFFCGLLSCNVLFAQKDVIATKYGEQVLSSDLKEYLSIIASDALEGRRTGTRGQKMAAAFIRAHFEEIGLQGPVDGNFFQTVPLYSTTSGNSMVKVGQGALENFKDFIYSGLGPFEAKDATVIFVGNGEAGSLDNIDYKGKAVLLISEKHISEISVSSLIDKGANAVFVCNTTDDDSFKKFSDGIKRSFSSGRMTLSKPGPSGRMESIIFVSPTTVKKIMGVDYKTLLSYAVDPKNSKRIRKVKPGSVSYNVVNNVKQITSENVLGYLEGTDKKDELVVVTAHFDHIGKRSSGTGDIINNGADDDGSGTVAVLELAKVFAKAKEEGHGPRRSMLFMTVTGEEIGLFGSQYYTEHPVFPLSNTVVDLNIDMIGRTDPEHKDKPDYVYVIGPDKLSQELNQLSEKTNATYTQLDFDYTYNDVNHPTNLYKRSDHWNFAKNNIPIIFYFDGIHEDYHLPSDEVEKIDFELLTKRARLIFYTAWELANRPTRIKND